MKHDLFKQEITPIATDDCFVVFERTKEEFDFPVHYHNEFELTCIKHGTELIRYAGEHSARANDWEMMLIGPNLIHGWLHSQPLTETIYEKTLQFHANLFSSDLLGKNALAPLKRLLDQSYTGILFSESTACTVFPLLHELSQSAGLQSFILLQQIFIHLLNDKKRQILNKDQNITIDNEQNDKLYSYIKKHYRRPIKLEEMADLFSMSVSSFNRIMKAQTGNTFVTFLNEYRLGMSARRLLETDYAIEYIAHRCGFSNLSNFNKMFKRVYKTSPQQYRILYKGTTAVK